MDVGRLSCALRYWAMGEGIGRTFRVMVYGLVGLSGLVISCAGPVQQRPQKASLSTRGEVTVRLEQNGVTAPVPHQGQVRVDEDFSAPQLENKFEAVAR